MAKKKRDDSVFMDDILECLGKIETYIEGVDEQEFETNTEKQDAVIRRIEIIGEAVKNLSMQLREDNSDIPWRQIAGMRDIVIHQYFGVTIGLVWRVATDDLPNLKERMMKIRKEINEN